MKIYCKIPNCENIAAIDDGLPNIQPVRGDDGKYHLQEVPWPLYCEDHDLRIGLIQFDRDLIQLTR